MQAPVILDGGVLSQLLQTPWTTKAILICELPQPQEEACQQLAGFVQCINCCNVTGMVSS